MELKILLQSIAQIPIAFLHTDHFSILAGKASVGEKVRWVGEDHIKAVLWKLLQEFQGITQMQCEIIFVVIGFYHKSLAYYPILALFLFFIKFENNGKM